MADDIIWGYQRVADGDACDFCLMLDGAQFRTDSPMPIHPFCGCGVEPVEYTRLGQRSSKARRATDADPAPSVRGRVAPDQEAALRRAAGEIQDEFGETGTLPTQLTYHEKIKGKGGDYDPRTGAIRVTTGGSARPAVTYAHEVGHRIDLGVGDGTAFQPGKNGSWLAPWGDDVIAAREELLEALMASKAGQGLLRAKKDIRHLWETQAGRRRNNAHVDYLLADEELIARAFAQYVCSRPGLRELFDDYVDEFIRSTKWAEGKGEHYNKYTQWEDDDFAAIIPLLKKYMRLAAKAEAKNTGRQPGRRVRKK